MRFAIDSKHREYFFKHHFLELIGALSTEECEALQTALEKDAVSFSSQRDLHLNDPILKRHVSKKFFAELLYDLLKKKPLRLLATEWFTHRKKMPLRNAGSLTDSFCFQDIFGGILIALSSTGKEMPALEGAPILPKASSIGSITLLDAETPIDFAGLSEMGESHLLLVFGSQHSVYKPVASDPYSHELKKRGFVFGDTLKENTHPTILR